jgi:murein L,D-transpeptidase YafK
LFTLAKSALAAGQSSFQVQALPFRFSSEALSSRSSNTNADFWAELKTISDAFDATHQPPEVAVCNGRYSLARRGGTPACQKI